MKLPVIIATCNLNQWSLDFKGNNERIIESIQRAKAAKARLRIGPELEITGYGCEDHFLESDTVLHAWESLKTILVHDSCTDILLDIGIPLHHNGVLYNCRVICLNRKIILIRPKVSIFLLNFTLGEGKPARPKERVCLSLQSL